MRRSKFLVAIALMAGLLALATGAQAQVRGTIQGYVLDSERDGVPGASVLVENSETGAKRTVFTNEDGFFAARALNPATYSVTASLDGMRDAQVEGVVLLVGQTRDVTLQLFAEAVAEAITVTSSPVIETSRSAAASYLDTSEIEAYPLAGRDFADITLAAPTVQRDADRGFITISGQRGIYSGLNIDGTDAKSAFFGYGRGGEATENDGLVIAMDSVKEFQVVTSGFAPEYGDSGGGYVNVVTKAGTNTWKGSLFYYSRDEGLAEDIPSSPLDDRRGVDGGRPVDAFSRDNWGLSLGGPIKKDRTHFYFSYDAVERDDPFTRDLNIPGLVDVLRSRGPEFAATVRGYEVNADGTATGLFVTSTENLILFGKVDHQFNDSNSGSFRINYTDFERTNNQPGQETLKAEETTSIVASLVSLVGNQGVNEFRIQDSEDLLDRLSDLNDTAMPSELEFRIGGRRDTVGKAFFLPIFVTEEKLQIQDNFSYLYGDHDLKFGVDYQKDDLSQLFAGFKDGRFSFSSFDNFLNNRATFELIFYGPTSNPNFDETQELTSLYAQDTFKPNPNLTLNYGIRWSQTDNPGGLQHIFPEGRDIPDDTDNFSPRFGFAYTPGGSGKHVVRGGAGLFYGRTPTLLFAGPVVQNGIFPNLGIVFALFFFDGFQPFGEPINNQAPPPGTTNEPNLVDPNYEDPETWRLNLGYERELKGGWTAGVDLLYAEAEKLQANVDTNLFAPTFDAFGRPIYRGDRPNTDFGEIFTRMSISESEYTAVTLKLNKRRTGRYSVQAHYTWSEDRDTDSNERSATGVTVSNVNDIRYDWGPSERDVENRFVVSGLVDLPLGFKLSGVIEVRDGTPWTPSDNELLVDDYCPHDNCPDIRGVVGGVLAGRNSRQNDSIERVDLRLTKQFDIGNYDLQLFAEVFNLFNEHTFFIDSDERQVTLSDGVSANPEFGIPDNLVTTPRQIQLGVRLNLN